MAGTIVAVGVSGGSAYGPQALDLSAGSQNCLFALQNSGELRPDSVLIHLYATLSINPDDGLGLFTISSHQDKPTNSDFGSNMNAPNGPQQAGAEIIAKGYFAFGTWATGATLARDAGPTQIVIPLPPLKKGQRYLSVEISAANGAARGFASVRYS